MNTIQRRFSLILGLGLAVLSFAPQAQAGTASKLLWHTPVKLGAATATFFMTFGAAFQNGKFIVIDGLKYIFLGKKKKDGTRIKGDTNILDRFLDFNDFGLQAMTSIALGAATLICLKSWLNAITASDDEEDEIVDHYEYSNY